MNIQKQGYLSIARMTDNYLSPPKKVEGSVSEESLSFQDILRQKSEGMEKLKFSKHAMGRLADRKIELTDSQLERLEVGARKAEQKGIRDSLVMVDQLAFIVNVPNRTVVTAMDSTETNDNIFTNINGAVIM